MADAVSTVHVVRYVEVSPSRVETARERLRAVADRRRESPGNRRVEVLEQIERPDRYVVMESWADAVPDGEGETSAAALGARLPADVRLHSAFAGDLPGLDAPQTAVHVVTHVDVVPPRREEGERLLSDFAATSARGAGCLRFAVLQQADRPNHFTILEAWRDPVDHAAHADREATRAFREALLAMSGSPYDERLYLRVA